MKTCKNCGTSNEAHVTNCISCNMEGQFTLHAIPMEPKILEEQPETIQCSNCGDQQLSAATHCTTCRFPLAEVKVKTIHTLSAKLGQRKIS